MRTKDRLESLEVQTARIDSDIAETIELVVAIDLKGHELGDHVRSETEKLAACIALVMDRLADEGLDASHDCVGLTERVDALAEHVIGGDLAQKIEDQEDDLRSQAVVYTRLMDRVANLEDVVGKQHERAKQLRNGPKSYDKRIAALEEAVASLVATLSDRSGKPSQLQAWDSALANLRDHEHAIGEINRRVDDGFDRALERRTKNEQTLDALVDRLANYEESVGSWRRATEAVGGRLTGHDRKLNSHGQALMDALRRIGELSMKIDMLQRRGSTCGCCDGSCQAAEDAMHDRLFGNEDDVPDNCPTCAVPRLIGTRKFRCGYTIDEIRAAQRGA